MAEKTIEQRVTVWDGQRISKPGIYSRVPLDAYHGQDILDGPSVSSSNLRLLCSKSPKHFYDKWSGNPGRDDDEPSKSMILGRAAHHLALGQANFAKEFAMPPDEYPDKDTGELKKWTYGAAYCKRWRAKQQKLGLTVLSQDMSPAIIGMSRELARNPIVRNGGLGGLVEHSIFMRDEQTGLWIKVRPDAIPTTSVDAVDLKTIHSVLYDDIHNAIFECGYHQQAALTLDAFRLVLGMKSPTFTFVFVESKRPFCVVPYEPKMEMIDKGRQQNRWALDKIARCIEHKEWPGPANDGADVRYVEFKEWAQKRIDAQLEFEQ